MKKIVTILMTAIMMMNLCTICAWGAGSEMEIDAARYSSASGTPRILSSGTAISMTAGMWVGYDIDCKDVSLSKITLVLGTSPDNCSDIEVRLDGINGKFLGTISTKGIRAALSWSRVSYSLNVAEEVTGKHKLFFRFAAGIHDFHKVKIQTVSDRSAFGFITFEYHDRFTDIAEEANRLPINLIGDLEWMQKGESEFIPKQPVSRAEFARIIGNIINTKQFADKKKIFVDVDSEHEDFQIINGLYQLGVIEGNLGNEFLPSNFITLQEAATMCVRLLGYAPTVRDKNYYAVANQLKLLDGVNAADGYLRRNSVARLIYNTITGDYLEINSIVENDKGYYSVRQNILEKYGQVYHNRGIVTANCYTGLYAPEKNSTGVTIGEESFEAGSTGAHGYLGSDCEYFYKENSMDGTKTLLAIRPSRAVETVTLVSNSVIGLTMVSENELSYENYEEDKTNKLTFDSKTSFIYNGKALDQPIGSLIQAESFTGKITAIDNNRDSVYDCVWIDHAKSFVLSGATDSELFDETTGETIRISNPVKFQLYIDGVLGDPSDLKKDEILTVYESANQKGERLVRVTTKKQTVEGMVNETQSEYIAIDGVRYELAADYRKSIEVGLSATFHLNDYQEVVTYYQSGLNYAKVGLLLGVDKGKGSFTSKVKVKLLTEKDEIVIFEQAEAVQADGQRVKDGEALYNGSGLFCGLKNIALKTPVLYRLNTKNQLSMIDTYASGAGNEDDGLTKLSDKGSFRQYGYCLYDGSWRSACPVSSNAKVINLMSDGNEKRFTITNGLGYHDTPITVTPYAVRKDSMIAEIIIWENRNLNKWANPFVFDHISKTLDETGDEILRIYGYTGNEKVSYLLDSFSYNNRDNEAFRNTVNSFKQGDFVQPYLLNNKLTNLELIFLRDGAESNAAGVSATLNLSKYYNSMLADKGRFVHGEVAAIEGDHVKLKFDSDDNCEYFVYSGAAVITCTKDSQGYQIVNNQYKMSIYSGMHIVAYVRYSDYSISTAIVYPDVAFN